MTHEERSRFTPSLGSIRNCRDLALQHHAMVTQQSRHMTSTQVSHFIVSGHICLPVADILSNMPDETMPEP